MRLLDLLESAAALFLFVATVAAIAHGDLFLIGG